MNPIKNMRLLFDDIATDVIIKQTNLPFDEVINYKPVVEQLLASSSTRR
jgi:hypothetical protein